MTSQVKPPFQSSICISQERLLATASKISLSPPLMKKNTEIIYNLLYFLSSVLISSSEYKNQPLAWSLLPNGSQSLSIAGNNTVNHPGKAKILSGFRQQAGGQSLPPSPGWICLSEVSDGSSQAAMAGMHCHCSGYLHAYERWHGVFRSCLDTHIYEPCLGSVQLRNKVTGRNQEAVPGIKPQEVQGTKPQAAFRLGESVPS